MAARAAPTVVPRRTGQDSVQFDRYHSVEPLSYGVLPGGLDVYVGERSESSGGLPGDRQIGRASCRERVYISVVGLSLKKTTTSARLKTEHNNPTKLRK